MGSGGSIVHYDGSGFTKLETGHDVRLISVSGSDDGEYAFAAGYSFVLPTQSTALMIHNNQVTTLYCSDHLVPSDPNDFGSVAAVSVLGDTAYFVTNIGLWKYNYRDGRSALDRSFHDYTYNPLIVQNINDIYMAGGGGRYMHFNGIKWYLSMDLYNQHHFAIDGGDFKGDLAVMAGYVNFGVGGVILRGYR